MDFSLTTGASAHCAWSIGDGGQTTAFVAGEGTTAHSTTITGLSADTKAVNEVYVRCDSGTGWPLHLRYRALPAVNLGYPRSGNLWSSWEVQKNGGIPHCARIPLWLVDVSCRTKTVKWGFERGQTRATIQDPPKTVDTSLCGSRCDAHGKSWQTWTADKTRLDSAARRVIWKPPDLSSAICNPSSRA